MPAAMSQMPFRRDCHLERTGQPRTSTTTIEWHYPRDELTENILHAIDCGASTSLTLVAPMKMGKTDFLCLDLMPEALKRGYRPVYASFKSHVNHPATILSHAIGSTLPPMLPIGTVQSESHSETYLKKSHTRTTEFNTPGSDAADPHSDRADIAQITHLQSQFHASLMRHDRILLCLDDADGLAVESTAESFLYSLRSILEQNRDRIAVVFTGSDHGLLRVIFRDPKAALFKSSVFIDLPTLGDGFVKHIRACFRQTSGRAFTIVEGRNAFEMVGRSPFVFRSLVTSMLDSASNDIVEKALDIRSGP